LPRRDKYHPYSRKYKGSDILGKCLICGQNVYRKSGFIVREQWMPEIKKDYIHHSLEKKCFTKLCEQERIEDEAKQKKKLNLPDNPLDALLK
tara:strand:- start:265 stop:540 length:276 start_codon:yes stop_codon:yes gene_type:complete